MHSLKELPISVVERILAWAILGILFAYTYALFFEQPYAGFNWDTEGRVKSVFVTGQAGNQIVKGDRLVRVGSVSWERFEADFRTQLFRGAQAGDAILIFIERDGREIAVDWTYPGLNHVEFDDRAIGAIWFAFFFWLLGTVYVLHVRPKGVVWALGATSNYLTALWIVLLGNLSEYHIWYSPFALRFAVWFCAAAYLQFHWMWPRPLGRLPARAFWFMYLIVGLIAAAECLQWLPREAYRVGLGLMFGGSMIFLLLHFSREPAERPGLRRLLIIGALGVLPLTTIPLLDTILAPNRSLFLGLMGLPLAAFGYFSAIFRHQLGGLKWRMNRIFSIYAFIIVTGVLMIPVVILAGTRIRSPGIALVIGILAGMVAAVASTLGFPAFQSFVERRLLGTPVPSNSLIGAFAARITTRTSKSGLAILLKDEILPSLLVQQFAFLQFEDGQTYPILITGVTGEQVPDGPTLLQLLPNNGKEPGIEPPAGFSAYPWIRLVIPLRVCDDLNGVWLIGGREPDNTYSLLEIPLIRSLANQTALALSNMIQADRLRALYQANVTRGEEERLRLALKLHDSILNHMAAMIMKLDASSFTSAFQESYNDLGNRIREIVSDLRPPMLTYGLMPAIQDLCERLTERDLSGAKIRIDLPPVDIRYTPQVELHFFRIVQESLENALKHAGAKTVAISGRLEPDRAMVLIQDDGQGFEVPAGAALEGLIAQKHFGLAGLMERANLIGGNVEIESAPGQGTRIQVSWRSKPT